MFTKPFSQLSKKDSDIAGGKGASLGEMLSAGIPVPDGFVVLSTTFDEFLHKSDLIQEIDAILESVDHKTISSVESASEKIQELIKHASMPDDIKTEIESQFAILDSQFVAVRSSATAEDGADHAWAGQLDSYLNTTQDTLLEKVQHCWASLFTPRAIFYRFEKGLDTTKISVAVVVQKMVNSEKSGIAFSVHPVTEDRNQIIIEAGFGLGEAIVSGSVTPDSYVITKQPREIIDINVSNQTRAMYRKAGGGNEWLDIPEKGDTQVFNDSEILALSEIIMTIENHYGFPCDIEWAFEGGKFYIVQSRPITTLSNVQQFDPGERYNAFKEGVLKLGVYPNLYPLDCENWHNQKHNDKFFELFGVQKGTMQYFEIVPEGVLDYVLTPKRQPARLFNAAEEYKERNGLNSFQKLQETFYPKRADLEKKVDEYFKGKDFSKLSKEDRLELFNLRFKYLWEVLPYDLYGYISTDIWQAKLYEILEKKIPTGKESEEFNTVLAALVQPETPSSSFFEYLDVIDAAIRISEGTSEINNESQKLAETWGHIPVFCYGDRWSADHYSSEIDETLKEHTIEELKKKLEEGKQYKKHRADTIEKYNDQYGFTKEELQYFIDFGLVSLTKDEAEIFNGYVSHYAPALYKLMAQDLGLGEIDFKYLYISEVNQAFSDSTFDYKSIIQKRKTVNSIEEPNEDFSEKFFVYDNESYDILNFLNQKLVTLNSSASCAYPGIVTGAVKIVNSVSDISKIQQGDIMICQATTVDYLLGMKKAGAIVTEFGGLTCHAAVVAREFKTPCVVGMKDARNMFSEGTIVTVNASACTITSSNQISFLSPELKDFKPEEYHFDGLWKNDLFPTCFWQDCWVPDVVEKLDLDLQGVGVMNLQGGHFLVHKPTREIMDRQIKKMVDEKNSAFFKNLIHVSDEIFVWALEKGDSLKTKEPTVENFREFVATAKRLNFLWLIGATYTNWPIEEKLQEAVIADQFPPEHVLDIVPKIITPLHDYQHGLGDLKKEIAGRTLEQVKEDKEFFKKLTDYAEKYVWVETFNFIGEPMNSERLYEQVIHLENKEDAHADYKPEKPLSEKLQFAAECLHDVGYVKQGGAEYFSMFSEKVIPFLNTVASKIGVTYREFMCLLIDEVDQALQGKLDSNELKKRAAGRIDVNNWAVIGDKTGKMVFIDNITDILSLVDKMIPRTGADATEFVGQIGNRGKYTGPARIIMNTYDFDKIQQGDVLVTTMTTPDFIVLMQKSGAIVTDIGGLLCHAAIVSREMKKPCVIGTKFATQILKDGDMVEVDADNGIVRILKKKNNIELVKEYTRDTTIIMQEAWGICCGTYIKELLNLINPYRPGIIHYMNDGSIEIWENKQSTQWLMNAILEKNTSDPTFLPQIIESYKKQLEEIKNYWKDEYLHDLSQFPEFFEKIKKALGGFIPYYYSAVDERTPANLRKMALELRDKDEFFAINDVFIRDTLLKHYPTIRGFETNVFSDEVINLPDISILKDRRNRMTLIDGVERTVETLDELSARKPELNFISEKLEFAGQEITGQIAFKGNITGIVRILRRRDQVDEVQEGEIIVSPMTTPDFMPAMQKAVAFVTDEGGITCHAAIVARELGKPCIIGTKFATQILHDGDLIEVDANAGIIKLLKKNSNTRSFHKEYTRDYTYIMQEGWYEVVLNKFTRYGGKQNPFVPPVIFYMNDGAIEVWENSQATPWILDTLQEKIKSDPLFIPGMLDQHERELSHIQEYWNKGFVTSLGELKEFIRLAHEYMYAFDFMYYSGVDERTPTLIRERALKIRDADKYFGTCDDVIRASIRAIYPELNGLENTLLVNEIDNPPSRGILEDRKRASVMVGHTIDIGSLSEFRSHHLEYKFNIETLETIGMTTLKGQIGNKGFGKGKVRILKRKDQINEIQEGEILVSAMTTPEFVPAMKKAAAIITDEGGITCHAAIVARELNKPCVIGTKFATEILKDGDEVEVDADNGIIKIINR